MDFLKLPELFKGEWENLLILTYGADIPFFENSLWRQFSNRCRNKIVLADAHCYLQACKQYADNGLVRFLNQRYVVDGIFIPQSAHAKLILLTNREKGRLIVGSGNLGIDGYASGGELFTHYEYNEKSPDTLPVFLSTWEFVQEMIARGYVGASVIPYLRHLHSQTPWLFQAAKSDFNQIRHNLTTNFLAQMKEVAQGEEFDELWILSPFYDEKAYALKQLLSVLSPKKVTILIQAGRTSLDPDALQKVVDGFSGKCSIHTFRLKEDNSNTYVHAKLYLAKTKKQAICFQGSPNLSQVAMLLTAPSGNIELANLSIGAPGDFDYLFENLEIDPETSALQTLNLSFDKPDPDEEITGTGWHLTGGSWQETKLLLHFHGDLPDISAFKVKIGTLTFPIQVLNRGEKTVEIRLPDEAKSLLTSPVPVSIVLNGDEQESNPVFVCNTAALNREMLEVVTDELEIEEIGDLDLDDETLERLLGELEAALVIDRRSVWQMAGKTLPKIDDDDDEALRLDYSEIDYEQLRRHPKILHYLGGVHGGDQPYYSKSRLQIILNAITDHFNGLVNIATGQNPINVITEAVVTEATEFETEQEREEEDKEKQRRRRTARARVRQILKNFIKRYIRGIKSQDFQELAGFDVMARNYIIFSHLLWRLFAKDWIEPEFIIESYLKIWQLFWGDKKNAGYYSQLDEKERQQVYMLIREHHSDGLLIAALYYAAHSSILGKWEDIRFSLRDFLRVFLSKQQLKIEDETIEEAWFFIGSLFPYTTPIPSEIIKELRILVDFENQKGFLHSIEQKYGYKNGSCSFEQQGVYREHLQNSATVDCLVIKDPTAITNIDIAFGIVQDWNKFKPRDYYRIISGDKSRIFYFDVLAKKGHFFQTETDEDARFNELPKVAGSDWEIQLDNIIKIAFKVNNTISLMTTVRKENLMDLKSNFA